MKKAIVYSSITGNTELLANTIKDTIKDFDYIGKPIDDALDADIIYVGSWTMKFTCTSEIKEFLTKLNNKKIFIFMTAGYGSSDEFLNPIINSVKENVNSSNEIIGEFICQGKVSQTKRNAIKLMLENEHEKLVKMEEEFINGDETPSLNDISNLKKLLK